VVYTILAEKNLKLLEEEKSEELRSLYADNI
jgi:hypothetical protein